MKRIALFLVLSTFALAACQLPGGRQAGQARTREADGATTVYVPAGTFVMGSTAAAIEQAVALCGQFREDCDRSSFDDELPTHTVTLDAFWIDRTEVTNAQYLRCVEAGACTATACPDNTDANGATQPVVCVSWTQARAYCTWAGGRLPSEAEWEYAARGPQNNLYPWGNDARVNGSIPANWSSGELQDVGSYEAGKTSTGLYDMAGNAWEWVGDWFQDDYYAHSPQDNPKGPTIGKLRVLRGGGDVQLDVAGPAEYRATYRLARSPDTTDPAFGFRCARDLGAAKN